MRERPKQASYLERHRQAEAIQLKGQSSSSSNSTAVSAAVMPKKSDKGGASVLSRVRIGVSRVSEKSPAVHSSACAGRMIEFKRFDDIPDGLPLSPQHIRDAASAVKDTASFVVHDENLGDDDEVLPVKQPSLPSEVESYFRDGCNYQKTQIRTSSEQLIKYPLLQAHRGVINQPMLYSSNCVKSAQEVHRDIGDDDDNEDDEKSWDNCSDGDSEPYNVSSRNMMSNYDSVETMTFQSKNEKLKREQTLPPDLPYENSQDNRRESKGKVDVREQLYFSRQPRQIDYTLVNI